MPENREGAIPQELYSTIILASGSIHLASKALPGTIQAYRAIPLSQRPHTLQVLINPVGSIVKNRATIDTQFKWRFGKRFFRATVDDGRAIVDISSPCQNETDFVYKVQALSGLINRVRKDAKNLIRNPRARQNVRGSINVLEAN